MLFTISGKHVRITDAVKSYSQEKTSKLPRFYDSINKVEVIIEGNPGGNIAVEIIASAEHNRIFVVSQSGQDAYKCIDTAVHKLQRQLKKIKGKERDSKHADNTKLQ